MMFFQRLRSRAGIAAVTIAAVATSAAGAATVHRLAITSTTGSEGATTVLQSSATSSALQGEVNSKPNTSIRIPFGVLGEYDAAGTTFGSGTLGISTTGYGVGAESLSATQPSMIALNTSGGNGTESYGEGPSTPDASGFPDSQGGAGILATSTNGNAVMAESATDSLASIYAEDDAPDYGYGVFGFSNNGGGTGLYGFGSAGVIGESETTGAASLFAVTGTQGTDLMEGFVENFDTGAASYTYALSNPSLNASGTADSQNLGVSSDLQLNGDIYISGKIYTGCVGAIPQESDPNNDCLTSASAAAKSRSGVTYTTYTAQHASATMEDEGETRLVNGYAHVALDPAFASTISSEQPYLVFTTPMGESRGLYVSNRTATGFDVRENAAGRSSMTFDYRIVAHPFGTRIARMSPVVRNHTVAAHKMTPAIKARMRMISHLHQAHAHTMLKSHVMPRSFLSYAPARR